MSMVSGVIGGVDTHADVHVAAALDQNGAVLGIESFPVNEPAIGGLRNGSPGWSGDPCRCGGHRVVWRWTRPSPPRAGIVVVEVDRPNRQKRRRLGKSDPINAGSAARAALSGEASVTPKQRDGTVEQIRVLLVAAPFSTHATQSGTQPAPPNVICGPEEVRAPFKDRYKTGFMSEVAAMRPRKGSDPVTYTTHVVMRGLARRIRDLDDEMRTIDDALTD